MYACASHWGEDQQAFNGEVEIGKLSNAQLFNSNEKKNKGDYSNFIKLM